MRGEEKLNRRQFMRRTTTRSGACLLATSAFSTAALSWGGSRAARPRFEHRGLLIGDSTLPGETRADDVFAAHPNGIQVSRNRWLLLYATRGFRGTDDDRSIVYQLRRDAPDGPVVTEGMLARSINNWDPFGEGQQYVKQHGHPVGFGVPRGAWIDGEPASHANLFVVKWRVLGLVLDQKTGEIHFDSQLAQRTQGVEWTQLRLNQNEDDMEIVRAPAPMRQRGYEFGEAFCSAEQPGWMNQTYTQAIPFNREVSWPKSYKIQC